ncbi:MAG: c-type cytochrome domain-containing protein, partial [Planctomycetaceae bacterium]
MRVGVRGLAGLAVVVCLWLLAAESAQAAGPDYATQVAPIFKKYCAGCHNAEDKEGKLSVESYDQLQRGGAKGPAVLAGNVESSRLFRLLTGVAQPVMPPKDNARPTAGEIATVKAWIEAGALGPRGASPDRTRLLVPRIAPLEDAPRAVTALDYSGDGKLLAIGRFRNVVLKDTRSGRTLRTLGGLPGKVNTLQFSRDSRLLITGSGIAGLYGRAAIWNVADGTLIREFVGHRDTMYAAVLSPDAQVLATGSYDRKIILWDVATGKPLRTLTGHNGAIYDLAFHPDGHVLASASGDKTVKLWRVDTGQRLDTMSQPLKEQYVVRFDPRGEHVLAAGADNRIRVWRLKSR